MELYEAKLQGKQGAQDRVRGRSPFLPAKLKRLSTSETPSWKQNRGWADLARRERVGMPPRRDRPEHQNRILNRSPLKAGRLTSSTLLTVEVRAELRGQAPGFHISREALPVFESPKLKHNPSASRRMALGLRRSLSLKAALERTQSELAPSASTSQTPSRRLRQTTRPLAARVAAV